MEQRKYATRQLSFFYCGEINENAPKLIQSLMRGLVSSRMWACSPPVFVDTTDEVEPNNQYGDLPVRNLGGTLTIYAANEGLLPLNLDERTLDDVIALIESVLKFSAEHLMEFEFYLDHAFVGIISDGHMDASLEKGLIDEWRQHLIAMKYKANA